MATFDPDQSLLPSVGGSITPMSGGGTPHQEGGEKKSDGTYLLLEATLADYNANQTMMSGIAKMAPVYFKNKTDTNELKGIIGKLFEGGNTFDANELKIKQEILQYVAKMPLNNVKRLIDPEKKGSIENTRESQLKVANYIASRKVDVAQMKMTLNANTLVIKYEILPLSASASESGSSPPGSGPSPPGSGSSPPGSGPKPSGPKPSGPKPPDPDDIKRKIDRLTKNKVAYGFPPNYDGKAPHPHVMPTAKIIPKNFIPSAKTNTSIYIMVNSVNDAIEELHSSFLNHEIDVLNFANKNHVGGGVEEGKSAQEEELCRTSPVLYNSLLLYATPESISSWKEGQRYAYPTQEWTDFLLYTPNVPITRHDVQQKYESITPPIIVSVITAAADDSHKTDKTFTVNKAPEQLKTNFKKLISSISKAYTTAKTDPAVKWKAFDPATKKIEESTTKPPMTSTKKRILLLGPWGCGAFAPQGPDAQNARNEYRKFVATQFCEVLTQTDMSVYDRIVFTFYEPVIGKVDKNLELFVSVFKGEACFKDKLYPFGSKLTEDIDKWNKLIA